MMMEVIKYLREMAQTCTRFARACPHSPTSHSLEEIAMDLMVKAKELEEAHSESTGACSRKSEKIFVVDDDESIREAMKRLVQALGYDTETFISAEDCLEHGRITEASCLITDIQMPGMDGFALHSRLHSHGYRIPVIFMSGCASEAFLNAANEAGAIGFLQKPLRTNDLSHYLDKALKWRPSDR